MLQRESCILEQQGRPLGYNVDVEGRSTSCKRREEEGGRLDMIGPIESSV